MGMVLVMVVVVLAVVVWVWGDPSTHAERMAIRKEGVGQGRLGVVSSIPFLSVFVACFPPPPARCLKSADHTAVNKNKNC